MDDVKYIVIELQTNSDGSVGNIATAHDTQLDAESKFHSILAAAALSQLPVHAAVMLSSDGNFIDSRSYRHDIG